MTDIDAKITRLKQDKTSALTAVTKQRTLISKLMCQGARENVGQVKIELDNLNFKFENYMDKYRLLVESLSSEEAIEKEERRYEEREKSLMEFRGQVLSWITLSENYFLSCNDSASQVSRSLSSSTSSDSSSSSEMLSSSRIPKVPKASQSSSAPKSSRASKSSSASKSSRASQSSSASKSSRASQSSRASKSSSSSKSSSLSESSNASTIAKLRARVAELLVEKKMLNKLQELKAAEEELALNIEIEKAKAREKALVEEQTVAVAMETSLPTASPALRTPASFHRKPEHASKFKSRLNPIAKEFVPKNPDKSAWMYDTLVPDQTTHPLQHQQLENIVHSYHELTSAISLPQPKVPVFKGDPTEYVSFVMAFGARIESKVNSDSDRLYYLDQYLEGEPKDLIGGCLYLEPTEGYAEARRLLHEEYGDSYKIAMAYVSQVLSWPIIKYDDSTGLRKFSLFLLKCKNAMKNVEHLKVLNHPPNMQAIIQKLPYPLQNKWREQATKMKKQKYEIASFTDLVEFITSAADSANHPIYGKEALKVEMKPSFSKSKLEREKPQKTYKTSNFATSVEQPNTTVSTTPKGQVPDVTCARCKKSHDLDDCKEFGKLSNQEKKDFLKEKSMCFSCYGTGHVTKGCTNKRTCKVCNKFGHPTALHIEGFTLDKKSNEDDKVNRPASVNNASIDLSNEPVVLHTILPVKVKKKDCDKIVVTYAFYDGGSGGCFVTEDLQKQLDATGVETSLQLGTMHGKGIIRTTALNDLVVTDLNNENAIKLPRTFTRDCIPVNHKQIPRPEIVHRWNHLQGISNQMPEYRPNLKIGILIGSNCPAAFEPLEVVPSQQEGPFAVRLRHGWTISTPLKLNNESKCQSVVMNRLVIQEMENVKEIVAPEAVLKMFELDFKDCSCQDPTSRGLSHEDQKFLRIVEEGTHHINGHYQVPLPFRQSEVMMPDNKEQALKRADCLKRKLQRNERYLADYKGFIDTIVEKGYARKIPEEKLTVVPGKVWYLPHHGVYHPHKPDKIRVVFDCSARYNGTSLNDQLMQGPDLTNSLVGVLQRFRREPVAIMADIEAMFHQVQVPIQQCDYLRFLWWTDGDVNAELEEYQMLVHLFGATSSPSCSNYALKRSSSDSEKLYGSLAAETVWRNFYVDDCLTSVEEEDTAVQLVKDLCNMCSYGGFHLTKFVCNRRNVLQTIPVEEYSKACISLDIGQDSLPIERALGVQWFVETDAFGFKITPKDKPATRRGILSIISSIYDPLGFVAPFILPAKKLLQNLCREANIGWDDIIPDQYKVEWFRWFNQLPLLEKITVNRCYKPPGFGRITSKHIHIFSDASSTGYGSCAYLRLTDHHGKMHCSFLFGKARLAPIKATSVPRLELTAATVSVRIGQLLSKELDIDQADITYYTDSTTVLRYIGNEQKRFHVFVANRVQLIRDCSTPSQWKYVSSTQNPADDASRGLDATALINDQRWIKGPNFLWEKEEEWPSPPSCFASEPIPDDDPEVKRLIACNLTEVNASTTTVHKLMNHFSDWYKLKKAVSVFLRLKDLLKKRIMKQQDQKEEPKPNREFTVQEIEAAGIAIVQFVQSEHFAKEIYVLSQANESKDDVTRGRVSQQTVSKSSNIRRLDPFIFQGILRVGGRLRRAQIPEESKHPIILPRKCHVTTLIIRKIHEMLGHAGRAHVLAKLRERYWVIGGNSATRQILYKCVICRRIQAPVNEQKMADLPRARLTPAPPFTFVGLDYFGPFHVKEGRKEHKRYGAIFTCLASRAVHIELASSLDTDSCIQALRRFVARRGPVREIYCDNGSNFIGTEKELRQAIQEIDNKEIQEKLLKQGIDWRFNPPNASHMGGIWERQIRTIRKILSGLLYEHGNRLNEESLHTLLCEVEAIINSRPLTLVSSEPDDVSPLTPNQLLTMKTNIIGYPPGEFQRNDIYLRRRWRRVQYLANLFWSRWKKEYLLTLQERPKWHQPKRNLKIGDVVLLKDDNAPRNSWSMGIVRETEEDSEGYVRSVKIKTQTTELRRPVNKLVLLLPTEDSQK